ncbi:MAG: chromate transporter [Thermaerobacter sp.]|nr:chromate transporter [Thermaerobacter sp.]
MGQWWALFAGFFEVGILGFGGGPGSISLIQVVTVDEYHWLTNPQFAEILAIGNALPGPIATKLAAAIGYQVAGPVGALAALVGVIGPSLVLMLGLYQVLMIYRSNPYVAGLIRGVKPIVIVLLVILIIDLVPTTFPRQQFVVPTVFFVAGFALLYWLKVPAVWVIVASMAGGAWFLR